jgi:sodium transport system permease protein
VKLPVFAYHIAVIFGKEMRETLRDRRTLFITVLLPILLYPLLILGTSHAIITQVGKMEERKVRLAISGESAILQKILQDSGWFVLLENVNDVAQTVQNKKADLGLTIPPEFDAKLKGRYSGPIARLTLHYTRASETSQLALGKLQLIAKRLLQEQAKQNLTAMNESVTVVQPFRIILSNTATPEEAGAMEIGRILAFLIMLMALSFSLYPAIDMAAGERERGTMETLLLSPVSRHEIVLGKYLAIFTIAMLGSLLNLTSMGITFGQFANLANSEWQERQARNSETGQPKDETAVAPSPTRQESPAELFLDFSGVEEVSPAGTDKPAQPQRRLAFTISPFIVAMILLLMVPVTALFAAICLALSSFAKSYKEAQYYLTPLLVVIMPLGLVSMIPGISLTPGRCLIPVTGVVLLYKDLFLGQVVFSHIVTTFVATAGYAALALWWTTRLFLRETILLRESEDLRWEYWNPEKKRQEIFTIPQALALFLALLVAYHWISPTWTRWNFWGGQIIAQWLWLVFLPLLLAVMSRLNLARTFHLAKPQLKHLLIALPFAGGGLIVARELSIWQRTLFPVPPEYFRMLEEMMRQVSSDVSPLVIIFGIAITPGICEEFFFRGLVLSSLRRSLGNGKGVLGCAVLFAIMHMQLPNFTFYLVMGLLLGFLVVRTGSVMPAMLAHLGNNAFAAICGTFFNDSVVTKTLSSVDTHMPPLVIAGAIGFLVLGICLLRKKEI